MNSEQQNPEDQNLQGGHDVPLTPPPAEPAPVAATPPVSPPVSPPASPRSSSGAGARAGAIAIAAFGGIALLGAGGTAAFAAVHDVAASASPDGVGSSGAQNVSIAGIDALDVDAAASAVTVQFGDVEEATLEVTGSGESAWRLERDGDELVLSNDQDAFGWFGGGWFGDWFDNDETVVLTLPESLNDARLDADFNLSAGSLSIEGMFGDVDIEMGAGRLNMEGAAKSIETDISAGRADLDLFGVDEADFSVSAGKLDATLANTAPSLITISVSAGSLDLTVPDEVYNVSQDASAGSIDNRLDHSSDSRHRIDATVSAGSVILRSND